MTSSTAQNDNNTGAEKNTGQQADRVDKAPDFAAQKEKAAAKKITGKADSSDTAADKAPQKSATGKTDSPATAKPAAKGESKKAPEATPKKTPAPASAKPPTGKAPETPAKPAAGAEETTGSEAPAVKPRSFNALIIDDDPANCSFMARLIEQAQYTTVTAGSGKEALEKAQSMQPEPGLIIVDDQLPDTKGVELIPRFRELYPNAKIIMATMLDDRALIERAFKDGGDVFLVKPYGFIELLNRLKNLDTNPDGLSKLIINALGARPFR